MKNIRQIIGICIGILIGIACCWYIIKLQHTVHKRSLELKKAQWHNTADSMFRVGLMDEADSFYRLAEDTTTYFEWREARLSRQIRIQQLENEVDRHRSEVTKLLQELVGQESKNILSKSRLDSIMQLTELEKKNLSLTYQSLSDSLMSELKSISEINRNKPRFGLLRFLSQAGKKVVYLGEIQDSTANGYGIGVWSTGSIYEGAWKSNYRHGHGRFEWADGEKYEGNYVNDKRHGWGTYHWRSGERYEGDWKDDLRHGYGTVYDNEGKVKLKGKWESEKLVDN